VKVNGHCDEGLISRDEPLIYNRNAIVSQMYEVGRLFLCSTADDMKDTNSTLIRLNDLDLKFSKDVKKMSDTDFHTCLQCRRCSGGCPFSEYMDYMPNGVMRLVQLGLKREALSCNTIWICVGCHTCSIQCPMAIDIPGVLDMLRQMALAEGVDTPEPDVLSFHREVPHAIER